MILNKGVSISDDEREVFETKNPKISFSDCPLTVECTVVELQIPTVSDRNYSYHGVLHTASTSSGCMETEV